MVCRTLALALAAGLIAAGPASAAAILTFGFAGTVTAVDRDRGLFGPIGTVEVGDPFSGRFSYEIGAGNPDGLPADPTRGLYAAVELVVDGSVAPLGTLSILVQLREPGLVIDPPTPGFDRFTLLGDSANYGRGINLVLQAPFLGAFTDDGLPGSLDLAAFTDLAVLVGSESSLGGDPQLDSGIITALFLIEEAVVPGPGGGTLFAGLAGALLLLRRRRRNNSQRGIS